MENHYNQFEQLKKLTSVPVIEQDRKRIGDVKMKARQSILGKRKVESSMKKCPIDGCDGYYENEFYQHFSDHFYPIILHNLSTKFQAGVKKIIKTFCIRFFYLRQNRDLYHFCVGKLLFCDLKVD